jgi:hypothetical protein
MKLHVLSVATLAALSSGAVLADPPAAAPSAPESSVEILGHRPDVQQDPTRDLGSPGDGRPIQRIVRLGSKPTWVSIGYGDNVEFVVKAQNGAQRSFTWRFNGWPNTMMIRLSQVAPPDFFNHEVRVYIGPDRQRFGA